MTSCSMAFLRLCTNIGLWLLNGTSASCYGATSYHSLSYNTAQLVVDYALASPIAHALGICSHIENPPWTFQTMGSSEWSCLHCLAPWIPSLHRRHRAY